MWTFITLNIHQRKDSQAPPNINKVNDRKSKLLTKKDAGVYYVEVSNLCHN